MLSSVLRLLRLFNFSGTTSGLGHSSSCSWTSLLAPWSSGGLAGGQLGLAGPGGVGGQRGGGGLAQKGRVSDDGKFGSLFWAGFFIFFSSGSLELS